MAPISVKVTGWLINLVGLVHSRSAGRLAFALFATTRSPEPATAKERALFEQAGPVMAEARLMHLVTGSAEVATWHFQPTGRPSGKTVLVVHGWGSRIDYLLALVSGLRERGHAVVGLDLPGHGRSSGRRLTVPMAIDAIDAASRQYGPFAATIGHSFGGFALVLGAAGAVPDVVAHHPGKLVLVGAPSAAAVVFAGFSRTLGLTKRVRRALDAEVRRVAGAPVEHFDAARMLAGLPVDTLVIHAEDDKEVDAEAARRYGAAGPHVTLHWANGLGHRRIISAPEVIDRVAAFTGNEGAIASAKASMERGTAVLLRLSA